jgi:hypothetical protein
MNMELKKERELKDTRKKGRIVECPYASIQIPQTQSCYCHVELCGLEVGIAY